MKLVLLPGLHGTESLFAPFVGQISDAIETQIICYPNDINLSYQQLQDLIVEQLPRQDYILLAESFSGPLAYSLAKTQTDNLKVVIFVASFLSNPKPWILNIMTLKLIQFLLMLPMPGFVIKRWLTGLEVDESIVSLCQSALAKVRPDLLAFRLSEIVRLPKQHTICKTKALYIQAGNDKLVPSTVIEVFKDVFNDLEIITMNSGHFVLQAQPATCAQIIFRFASKI